MQQLLEIPTLRLISLHVSMIAILKPIAHTSVKRLGQAICILISATYRVLLYNLEELKTCGFENSLFLRYIFWQHFRTHLY